jgi:hypothetical protein
MRGLDMRAHHLALGLGRNGRLALPRADACQNAFPCA